MPKPILYIVLGLLVLVVIGAVGYKIVAPTSKTVIEKGGKQVIVNTEPPKMPLGGCSIWRLNTKFYWEKNFDVNQPNREPEKK